MAKDKDIPRKALVEQAGWGFDYREGYGVYDTHYLKCVTCFFLRLRG